MTPRSAATWIAAADEIDRGNLLGAAVVTAQREDRELQPIIEGPDHLDQAVAAGRESGILILPEAGQVLPGITDQLALLEQAQTEGWRLLLLSLGADSAAPSGELIAELFRAMNSAEVLAEPEALPPPALRRRVSIGTESTFQRSGLIHVEAYESCLAQNGVRFESAEDLLDWGAGCGRMTKHLIDRAPQTRIAAADTDPEAIAWVGDHLDVAAHSALPLTPPSSLATDSFDVIVGHSVFSHLNVESQDLWLEELTRISRPGGHIAVSFNGPTCLAWHLEHPLVEVPDSISETVERDGIAVWSDDGWENEFYDGYHTTFHSHQYIREHWSRWADVLAIYDAAALPTQDIVVLRSR